MTNRDGRFYAEGFCTMIVWFMGPWLLWRLHADIIDLTDL